MTDERDHLRRLFALLVPAALALRSANINEQVIDLEKDALTASNQFESTNTIVQLDANYAITGEDSTPLTSLRKASSCSPLGAERASVPVP